MTGFETLRLHPAAGKATPDASTAPPAPVSPAMATDQPEVAEQPAAEVLAPPTARHGEMVANAEWHRKGPVCGCLERLRRVLLPQNGRPGTDRATGAAVLHVGRVDKAGAFPPILLASFCPFCGEAYE